ncbi:MAG: hypothetical protein WCL00_09015, partial [Bacteroidota bacterium]
MTGNFLETPVEFLKGVGPVRGEVLKKELGIFSFGDLMTMFPYRYVDRSVIARISDVKEDGAWIQIRAKV